jgi:transcriptional regulator with XRE-family HTH domain
MGDFGKRLRAMRRKRGWTRYRLAKLSGLSGEGIRRLEAPGSDPKLSTLFKLAAAFGVGVAEMLAEVRLGQEEQRGD